LTELVSSVTMEVPLSSDFAREAEAFRGNSTRGIRIGDCYRQLN